MLWGCSLGCVLGAATFFGPTVVVVNLGALGRAVTVVVTVVVVIVNLVAQRRGPGEVPGGGPHPVPFHTARYGTEDVHRLRRELGVADHLLGEEELDELAAPFPYPLVRVLHGFPVLGAHILGAHAGHTEQESHDLGVTVARRETQRGVVTCTHIVRSEETAAPRSATLPTNIHW